MSVNKTLREREKELQSLLATPPVGPSSRTWRRATPRKAAGCAWGGPRSSLTSSSTKESRA